MVTVGYEQTKGLREMHETPEGYQASIGRTFNARMGAVFEAWNDPVRRAGWMPDAN